MFQIVYVFMTITAIKFNKDFNKIFISLFITYFGKIQKFVCQNYKKSVVIIPFYNILSYCIFILMSA